jgi:hypothetical protein
VSIAGKPFIGAGLGELGAGAFGEANSWPATWLAKIASASEKSCCVHPFECAIARAACRLGSLTSNLYVSADAWADDVRLSDIEPRFVCTACGKRGADVRPNFNWNVREPIGGMGYR